MGLFNFFKKMDMNRYGWRPDKPDHRDLHYSAENIGAVTSLPTSFDWRDKLPPVYDQGELGSCGANAAAGLLECDWIRQQKPNPFVPSRLFIYYNTRTIEKTVNYDSGVEIRDVIKSLATYGFCSESLWPYAPKQFTTKPPEAAYSAAKTEIISQYSRVPQATLTIQHALVSCGPVIFGTTLYQSFESDYVAKFGVVPMPTPHETPVGGHAMLIVGYDDQKKQFLVRNSWGSGWGQQGYCWFPYAYLLNPNLADDFWSVSFVP